MGTFLFCRSDGATFQCPVSFCAIFQMSCVILCHHRKAFPPLRGHDTVARLLVALPEGIARGAPAVVRPVHISVLLARVSTLAGVVHPVVSMRRCALDQSSTIRRFHSGESGRRLSTGVETFRFIFWAFNVSGYGCFCRRDSQLASASAVRVWNFGFVVCVLVCVCECALLRVFALSFLLLLF